MLGLFFVGVTSLISIISALPVTKRQNASTVPQYVLDYAPLIWLDENETYLPSDIAAQISHTHPDNNYAIITNAPDPLNLENLDDLNDLGGADVYLTGNDDWTTSPLWTRGVRPDSSGLTIDAVSCTVITHEKANNILDAFYFYFYAYNQGDTIPIFNQELGDHLGDWEHTMVRFDMNTGKPLEAWLSEHENGEAFLYNVLEKIGDRAVVYSAKGSHANYATAGTHDHTIPDVPLPVGPLEDHTSQGTLWDPIKSAYFYNVAFPIEADEDDGSTPTFSAYHNEPVSWLYYIGQWGDDQLLDSDPRQQELFGAKKYVSGPTGPKDKQLARSLVCPNNGVPCIVCSVITPGTK